MMKNSNCAESDRVAFASVFTYRGGEKRRRLFMTSRAISSKKSQNFLSIMISTARRRRVCTLAFHDDKLERQNKRKRRVASRSLSCELQDDDDARP